MYSNLFLPSTVSSLSVACPLFMSDLTARPLFMSDLTALQVLHVRLTKGSYVLRLLSGPRQSEERFLHTNEGICHCTHCSRCCCCCVQALISVRCGTIRPFDN